MGQREEEGQSFLEMALVAPVLLLILVAVIDLARAFDAYIVLTNAVREGARWGSRDPSTPISEIEQMVVEDVLLSGTNVTNMADFDHSDVNVQIGTRAVTVTVAYDFDLWFGGLAGFGTLQLQKQSAMPIMIMQ
jgi:Flp pilus assembly protein TadG